MYHGVDIYGAVTDWIQRVVNAIGESERALNAIASLQEDTQRKQQEFKAAQRAVAIFKQTGKTELAEQYEKKAQGLQKQIERQTEEIKEMEETATERVFAKVRTLLEDALTDIIIMKKIGEETTGRLGEIVQKDADTFESLFLYVEKRIGKTIKTIPELIQELNLRIVKTVLSKINARADEFKRYNEETHI